MKVQICLIPMMIMNGKVISQLVMTIPQMMIIDLKLTYILFIILCLIKVFAKPCKVILIMFLSYLYISVSDINEWYIVMDLLWCLVTSLILLRH